VTRLPIDFLPPSVWNENLWGVIVAVWMHFLSLRHSVKALEGTQTTDISQEQSRQSFFLY